MTQFTQAMAGGIVRAEEWNSIQENGSEIVNILGVSLGKTNGELRQMVLAGELTSKMMVDGLAKGAKDVDSNFLLMQATIGQTMTLIDNEMLRLVGNINSASGSSKALAETMSFTFYGVLVAVTTLANGFEELGAEIAGISYRLENGIILTDIEAKALENMHEQTKKNIKERKDYLETVAQGLGIHAKSTETINKEKEALAQLAKVTNNSKKENIFSSKEAFTLDALGMEIAKDYQEKQREIAEAKAESDKKEIESQIKLNELEAKAVSDNYNNLQIDIERQRIADKKLNAIYDATASVEDVELRKLGDELNQLGLDGASQEQLADAYEKATVDNTKTIEDNTDAINNYTQNNFSGTREKTGLFKDIQNYEEALASNSSERIQQEIDARGGQTSYTDKNSRATRLTYALQEAKQEEELARLREQEIQDAKDLEQAIKDLGNALDTTATDLRSISDALGLTYADSAKEALFGGTSSDTTYLQAKANAQEAWDIFQSDTFNKEYLDTYNSRMNDLIGTLDEFNDTSKYNSSAEQDLAKFTALRQIEQFDDAQLDTQEETDQLLVVMDAILLATEDGVITAEENKIINDLSRGVLESGTLETNDTTAISWLNSVQSAVNSQDGLLQTTADNTGSIGKYRVQNTIEAVAYPQEYGMENVVTSQTYTPYKSGGYTGNSGINDIAGIVHGQEYVVNAQTTKDLGLNNSAGVFQEISNKLDMLAHLYEINKTTKKSLNTEKQLLNLQTEAVA